MPDTFDIVAFDDQLTIIKIHDADRRAAVHFQQSLTGVSQPLVRGFDQRYQGRRLVILIVYDHALESAVTR